MPRNIAVIFGASNMLWMVFAVSQGVKVEIFPESKIIAQIGGSASLTCSTTDCESPSFSWRTQMDSPLYGAVSNEGTKSTLLMDSVSFRNENSYLCTVFCGASKGERGFEVEIFSFPEDLEIHWSSLPEVGKPVTVKCLVPDVYPAEKLEIRLLKDNHSVATQDFLEPMDVKSQETKSLEFTFTPTEEDIGKALVCQATLDIAPEPQIRTTTEKMQVYISPEDPVISVNPSTSLQEGDSVMMTCTSEGLPAPQISWSKKLDNGNQQLLSGNATLTLIAMRMEDSGIYVCEGVNPVGTNRKEVKLTVQEKVLKVEVSPRPQIVAQIGDSVVLTCDVTGCESPSIAWRTKSDSPLGGTVRTEGSKSMLTLSPVSLENKHSYLCHVTCGRKNVQKEIQVEPYFAPSDTTISVSPSSTLEEGSSVNMTCSSDGLPAPKIVWSKKLRDETLERLSENTTLTLTSTKIEDSGVYVCEGINLAGRSRKEVELIIQAAPKDLQLTAFPSESVKEGDTVIISCTCGNVPPTLITLKKKAETGDTVLKSTDGAYTIHRARLADAGVYECESKNEVGLQLRSITLDVKGREGNKDYFSSELLVLYCASSLIIPAIGMIIYFARKANMKGSYSLVDAQKSKV